MNKKVIQIQKGQNVISAFMLLLSGMICNNAFSQTNLDGIYCRDYVFSGIGKCLTFKAKGIFKYTYSGDGGIYEYGNGEYKIENNDIILNYNKTEELKLSHHVSKIWSNKNEIINIYFQFLDFENKPIPYVNIFYKDNLSKNGYNGVVSNKEGIAILNLKKEKKFLQLTSSNIGFKQYKISINKNYNYNISVFLEKQGKGIPIKNQTDTLNIVKMKDNFFKIKRKSGKISLWKKIN